MLHFLRKISQIDRRLQNRGPDKIRRGPRERVLVKAKWSRVYVCQTWYFQKPNSPCGEWTRRLGQGSRERTGLRAAPDSLLSGSLLTVRCHDAGPGKQGKGNQSAGPRPTLKREVPYLVIPERHTLVENGLPSKHEVSLTGSHKSLFWGLPQARLS